MTTQSEGLGELGASPPQAPATQPRPARGAIVLAVFLLAASGIMLGGMIRRHFQHPLLDVVALLVLLAAFSAAVPPWRHAIGEAMVGMSVVLVAILLGVGLRMVSSLEMVVGALLLAAAGAFQLERWPLEQRDDPDAYWRTTSLSRLLLDLLVRRGKA